MHESGTLSSGFSERTAQLLLNYPEPEALTDLVRSDLAVMPRVWAEAIESASGLFEELQSSGHGSEDLKRKLRLTLRHYPDCAFKQLWCVEAQGYSIRVGYS